MWNIECGILNVEFGILNIEIRNPSFDIRDPKFEIRDPTSELQTSTSELRTSNIEIRNSNFKHQTSNFELRTSKFELDRMRLGICIFLRMHDLDFVIWQNVVFWDDVGVTFDENYAFDAAFGDHGFTNSAGVRGDINRTVFA